MPKLNVPARDYPKGEHVIVVPSTRGKFATVSAILSRESWPDLPKVLTIIFERSNDGGATWLLIGSSDEVGGEIIRDGLVLANSRIKFSTTDEAGTPRDRDGQLLRVRIVSDETFRSAIEVELLEASELGR